MGALRRIAERVASWAVRKAMPWAVNDVLRRAYTSYWGTRHPSSPTHIEANRGWVFAGMAQVMGRASTVTPILELCRRAESGGPVTKTRVHDHAALDLLARPNPDEDGMTFLMRQVGLLGTAGKLYVKVETDTVEIGPFVLSRIARLRLLEPHRTKVYGSATRALAAFEYLGQNGTYEVLPAGPSDAGERARFHQQPYPFAFQIVWPALDSYEGQSPVQAGANAINTLHKLDEMNQNVLTHGVFSQFIFWLKGGYNKKRFEEAVVETRQGVSGAGNPMVLARELVEVERSPIDAQDMQFPQMREASRDETLAILGVPGGTVGLTDQTSRANIEAMERIIAMGSVDPKTRLIASAYSEHLLPLYPGQSSGAWYVLSYASSAQADPVTEAELDDKRIRGGVYTPNEVREMRGLKPRPEGATLLLPGSASFGIGEGHTPEQVPTGDSQIQRAAGKKALCGCAGARMLAPPRALSLPSDHPLATTEGREAAWRSAMAAHRGYEADLRKALAPVFKRWREAAVQLITAEGPQLERTRQDDARADALEPETWVDAIADAYTPWALDVAASAGSGALADSEFDWLSVEPSDTLVADFAGERAPAMAEQLVSTTLAMLRDTLADAVADGASATEAAALAAEVFPSVSSARMRSIATTETTAAAGRGIGIALEYAQAAFELNDGDEEEDRSARKRPSASAVKKKAAATAKKRPRPSGDGPGEGKAGTTGGESEATEAIGLMWVSQRDAKVRDSHAAADGLIVLAGEAFWVGVCLMLHPGDWDNCSEPSELCNCRCVARIVRVRASAA